MTISKIIDSRSATMAEALEAFDSLDIVEVDFIVPIIDL